MKSIGVDLETYEKVQGLCDQLGVGISEFMRELVGAISVFDKSLEFEAEHFCKLGVEDKFECWRVALVRVIDKGLMLSRFFQQYSW